MARDAEELDLDALRERLPEAAFPRVGPLFYEVERLRRRLEQDGERWEAERATLEHRIASLNEQAVIGVAAVEDAYAALGETEQAMHALTAPTGQPAVQAVQELRATASRIASGHLGRIREALQRAGAGQPYVSLASASGSVPPLLLLRGRPADDIELRVDADGSIRVNGAPALDSEVIGSAVRFWARSIARPPERATPHLTFTPEGRMRPCACLVEGCAICIANVRAHHLARFLRDLEQTPPGSGRRQDAWDLFLTQGGRLMPPPAAVRYPIVETDSDGICGEVRFVFDEQQVALLYTRALAGYALSEMEEDVLNKAAPRWRHERERIGVGPRAIGYGRREAGVGQAARVLA